MMILWGHGNRASIPPLHTYEDAKAHFEKVVPIRGRGEQVKPLGKNRRYTWYRIAENTVANQSENSEYRTYSCKLYDKDTVTFYPNGDIHIDTSGWRDITTGAFINSVLNGIGNLMSESGKWYFRNKEGKIFRFNREMRLVKQAGSEFVYIPDNPVCDINHKLDRKAVNAIRKKYKDIIDYGKTMLSISPKFEKLSMQDYAKFKLGGGRFVPHGAWESKDSKICRARWFELADEQIESGDLELLYALAHYVAHGAGVYNYRNDEYTCEPRTYVSYLNEMIKHQFRDELFITETLPLGEFCLDRNKKYFAVNTY